MLHAPYSLIWLLLLAIAGKELLLASSVCWDTNSTTFKLLSVLHDRKTEHFKALAKSDHSSAIADHVKTTGHDIKWDHFDILSSGKTDFHCKIKETLFIQELKPSLNVNISSERLLLF